MRVKAKDYVNDQVVDGYHHWGLKPNAVYYVVEIDWEHYRVLNEYGEPVPYRKALFDVLDPVPKSWVTKQYKGGLYRVRPSSLGARFSFDDYFNKKSEAVMQFRLYALTSGIISSDEWDERLSRDRSTRPRSKKR